MGERTEDTDQVGPLVREPARPELKLGASHVVVGACRVQGRLRCLEGAAPRPDQHIDIDADVGHDPSMPDNQAPRRTSSTAASGHRDKLISSSSAMTVLPLPRLP